VGIAALNPPYDSSNEARRSTTSGGFVCHA